MNTVANVENVALKDANELVSIQLEKLGEKLGEYKVYDSQLPIAEIAGTRIVKCLYQINKATGKKAAENSYVRIPTKHLTEEIIVDKIIELAPYVLSFLEDKENEIIRNDHKNGILNVFYDSLGLDKIIDKLEADETSSRLTKEKVEAWYESEVAESLTVLFATKMGLDDNSNEEELLKLEMILGCYKKKFISLASNKVLIKEEDCISMINVIKSCEAEGSLIGRRFIGKLEKMSVKKEDLLFSL